jgi:hypothetical protein
LPSRRSARSRDDDYRTQHRPPDADYGAPLHDLTANGIYPKDVYVRPDWYSGGEADFWTAFDVVARRRGRPDARLWIFRAMPCEVKPRVINQGDWVTTVRSYARQHAKGPTPEKDMCVIAARTEARCLHTDGNSLFEWGYNCPVPLKGQITHRPRRRKSKPAQEP